MNIKGHKSTGIFSVILIVNFLLFAVKLYVGLSSNSISIYSDGINNLFDGASAAAGLISLYILAKSKDLSFRTRSEKTEQLLSFALSVIIFLTGFIFFFNSAERLMYPAPVWFTAGYFYIIALTSAVKLCLFIYLKKQSKKNNSQVIRLMSLDSLTDFFITSVTLVTLWLTQHEGYSFDALGGIFVSILILVSGVRSLRESLMKLICYPEKAVRKKAEEILSGYTAEASYIEYSFSDGKKLLFKTDVAVSLGEAERLKNKIKEETDFDLYFLN